MRCRCHEDDSKRTALNCISAYYNVKRGDLYQSRCRTCRTWIAGRIQHTKADTEIDMAVSAYNTVSVWQCFRREEHKLSRSI